MHLGLVIIKGHIKLFSTFTQYNARECPSCMLTVGMTTGAVAYELNIHFNHKLHSR